MKAFEVFILVRHRGIYKAVLKKLIVVSKTMPNGLALNLRENEEFLDARELQGYDVVLLP